MVGRKVAIEASLEGEAVCRIISVRLLSNLLPD